MSNLISFIESLKDQSYETIKNTFEDLKCRVIDNVNSYMIYAPNEIFNESTPNYLFDCVGTILSKNTNKILCYGFPKTLDYNGSFNYKKIIASEYIDGSLIRAYWDTNTWKLSTNGSINAYESYWISEKSFGELFDDCLSRIYKSNTVFSKSPLIHKLDKTCCYQFLIKHPSVHIDQTKKPLIYHIGTYDLTTCCYVEKTTIHSFKRPKIIEFESLSELLENIKNTELKGYIFYSHENSDTQHPRLKLLSEKYLYLRKLLGNTPNLYFRYLECKYDGTSKELIENFPSILYYSSWVEKSLYEIVKNAYHIYVEKFIKRQPNYQVNYFYRPILKDIHSKYFESKQKITIQIVSSIVHSYHPKRLLFILNGLKYLNTNNVYDPTIEKNDVINETKVIKTKEDYGNTLYPLVVSIVGEEKAPKICGMILEMDFDNLENLVKNNLELEKLCIEALSIIDSKL